VGEQPKYRELEHTGDLAIEVTAATREELFAHSLVAMARLMVEEDGIAAAERREIRCDAGDDADMIRDLLAAALNLFLIDGFIWRQAEVKIQNGAVIAAVTAVLTGEQYDSRRHQLLEEIKAVTYHRLAVEKIADTWRATIVFDA
jgi:SHS2 domain-containing protein